MSYIQYKRYRGNVTLTNQGLQQIQHEVPECVSNSNNTFNEIMQQLNRVSNKFHELNDIADEVVNKFERKVTIRGANHPDEVMLLQAILDHTLSEEDVALLCSYIDCLFKIILREIQHANSKFHYVKSIPMLHKLRTNDRELSNIYDRISKYCGINNSGGRRSHIYQLYKFYCDFDTSGGRKEYLPEAGVSSFYFKPSKSFSLEKDENQYMDKDEKYLKMPSYENLWDSEVVRYGLTKIQVSVQNQDLSNALQRCVRAVQRKMALQS